MRRRCSHCSKHGHNSRTCPTRNNAAATNSSAHSNGSDNLGIRLFGATEINGPFIKKSANMGDISHHHSNLSSPSSSDLLRVDGCLSDDPNHASCSSNHPTNMKKGMFNLLEFVLR